MDKEKIISKIKGQFPDIQTEEYLEYTAGIRTESGKIPALLKYVKNEPELKFETLLFITAVDYVEEDKIELIYLLSSLLLKDNLIIKCDLDRNLPETKTVSNIFHSANWHERELLDLFGVTFTGHPDPRRILLPEEMQGYPMRKDFENENLIRRPDSYDDQEAEFLRSTGLVITSENETGGCQCSKT